MQSKLERLLSSDISVETIVDGVPIELLRTHKFDDFLPDSLLRSRAVDEWMDWKEGQQVLAQLVRSFSNIGTVG